MSNQNTNDMKLEELIQQAAEILSAKLFMIDDVPIAGVSYLDFYQTYYAHSDVVKACMACLESRYREQEIDAIVGIGNGGFGVAACLALTLDVPFYPIRKQEDTVHNAYATSVRMVYATRELTLARDMVKPGSKVVLVDDSISSGGTVQGGLELLREACAEVIEVATIFETTSGGGRQRLAPVQLFSIFSREMF